MIIVFLILVVVLYFVCLSYMPNASFGQLLGASIIGALMLFGLGYAATALGGYEFNRF